MSKWEDIVETTFSSCKTNLYLFSRYTLLTNRTENYAKTDPGSGVQTMEARTSLAAPTVGRLQSARCPLYPRAAHLAAAILCGAGIELGKATFPNPQGARMGPDKYSRLIGREFRGRI